jgi:hypothetical protein
VAACAACAEEVTLLRRLRSSARAAAPRLDVEAIARAVSAATVPAAVPAARPALRVVAGGAAAEPSARSVPARGHRLHGWRLRAAAAALLLAGGSAVVLGRGERPEAGRAGTQVAAAPPGAAQPGAPSATGPADRVNGGGSATPAPTTESPARAAGPSAGTPAGAPATAVALGGALADLSDEEVDLVLAALEADADGVMAPEPEPMMPAGVPEGGSTR